MLIKMDSVCRFINNKTELFTKIEKIIWGRSHSFVMDLHMEHNNTNNGSKRVWEYFANVMSYIGGTFLYQFEYVTVS